MLVFKRREGEKFICEELGITITMLDSHRGWGRIGIEAPSDLVFHREEVLEAIKRDEKSTQTVQRVA